MKRNLLVLFVLTFLVTSLSMPVFAEVKSGAACKIPNQVKEFSGYRYTCKKIKNSLVWTKGSRVTGLPGANQNPKLKIAPTPFFGTESVTSDGFTVQILNHDPNATRNKWTVTASPSNYVVKFNFVGRHITGASIALPPETSATITVSVNCIGCKTSSATFSSSSAPRTKTLLETKLIESFNLERERDISFNLIIENPNLSAKNRYLIDEFRKHLRWLSGIGAGITKSMYVIYADSAEWMNDEFRRQGCTFTPGHKLPLGGFAIFADCSGKFIITRPNADREPIESSIETQNGLIHEAFHQWQDQAIRTGSDYGRRYGLRGADWPKWLIEGGAHAFSRYAYWHSNGMKISPEQIMNDWFREFPYLTKDCAGLLIRDMVNNLSNSNKGGLCAYSKGQVAVDVFIGKFGVNAYLALHSSPKSAGLRDFPTIFRTVTGQELESFYDEVDKELKARGWP